MHMFCLVVQRTNKNWNAMEATATETQHIFPLSSAFLISESFTDENTKKYRLLECHVIGCLLHNFSNLLQKIEAATETTQKRG